MPRRALTVCGNPSWSVGAVAEAVVKAAELERCMVVELGCLVGEEGSFALRRSSRLQPC